MNTIQRFATCLTFAATIPAGAVAQTRVCLGGDLDHLSSSERTSCNLKAQDVRQAIALEHLTGNWHIVVVCGEQGWRDYVAYQGESNGALELASVDTRADQGEIFLRESRLRSDNHSTRDILRQEFATLKAVKLPDMGADRHSTGKHSEASGI